MQFDLLDNLKVADLTGRLPGPLSSKILLSLGAKIIKIENIDKDGDPFNRDGIANVSPHFKDWYQSLNEDKNILKIEFSKERAQLLQELERVDLIIAPDGKFFNELLKSINGIKGVILLSGGQGQWKYLHDLNALGLTKTFHKHLEDDKFPPYLPFAGMAFGQYLATAALASFIKAQKEKKTSTNIVYLKDVTQMIFDTLHSEQVNSNGRFLHSGAFPCYQIYNSKDGKHLCLAAIEDKFWENLNQAFNLQLKLEDRFDLSGKTLNTLKNLFSMLSSHEIREKIKDTESCLTIVDKA